MSNVMNFVFKTLKTLSCFDLCARRTWNHGIIYLDKITFSSIVWKSEGFISSTGCSFGAGAVGVVLVF